MLLFTPLVCIGLNSESKELMYMDVNVHLVGPGINGHSDLERSSQIALNSMDANGVKIGLLRPMPQAAGQNLQRFFEDILPIARKYPDRFAASGGGGSLNVLIQQAVKEGRVTTDMENEFDARNRPSVLTGGSLKSCRKQDQAIIETEGKRWIQKCSHSPLLALNFHHYKHLFWQCRPWRYRRERLMRIAFALIAAILFADQPYVPWPVTVCELGDSQFQSTPGLEIPDGVHVYIDSACSAPVETLPPAERQKFIVGIARIDLNDDGVAELIVKGVQAGTGGYWYDVYRLLPGGRFKAIGNFMGYGVYVHPPVNGYSQLSTWSKTGSQSNVMHLFSFSTGCFQLVRTDEFGPEGKFLRTVFYPIKKHP